MLISELIAKLNKMKEKYGDINVCIPRIQYGTQDGYIDIDEVKYNKEYDCICITDEY